MLSLYDYDDANSTVPKDAFGKRKIYFIRYQRGDLFEKTAWHKLVSKDGEPEKKDPSTGKPKHWVYNHYVPHSRIIKALEDNILDRERADVVKFLTDLVAKLKIEQDEDVKGVDPLSSRLAYDAWAEWAISSIADWAGIMFYGPGTGDGAGTKLDKPTGPVNGAAQFVRVKNSAEVLKTVLNGKLDLAEVVPNESGTESAGKPTKPVDRNILSLFRLTMASKLPDDDDDDEDYSYEDMSDDEDIN
ncbi:hypothetical protein QBC37DRAFT_392348 [Rhypophila decipiens]|uniref:Uncharacterized protein n=1 Tax=Rhypophila decipiens TaxID=261697 RepID=A0AAN7B2N4_9PEZI|nr:hypothetical protein QBC37DRAFT_392348 [Rhypophila decipiens]